MSNYFLSDAAFHILINELSYQELEIMTFVRILN